MNHLSLIIKREYLNKVKNKSFIVMTFLSPIIMIALIAVVAYLSQINNDKDLKLAGEWVDKAIASNPKAYWVVLLKAKIQYKAKDFKGASATAEQVKVLAKEDQNDDYIKMADKIIADSKK